MSMHIDPLCGAPRYVCFRSSSRSSVLLNAQSVPRRTHPATCSCLNQEEGFAGAPPFAPSAGTGAFGVRPQRVGVILSATLKAQTTYLHASDRPALPFFMLLALISPASCAALCTLPPPPATSGNRAAPSPPRHPSHANP